MLNFCLILILFLFIIIDIIIYILLLIIIYYLFIIIFTALRLAAAVFMFFVFGRRRETSALRACSICFCKRLVMVSTNKLFQVQILRCFSLTQDVYCIRGRFLSEIPFFKIPSLCKI